MSEQNKLVVFQEQEIRRVWHNEEWYYSIIDVIEVLTDSPQPSRYWNELRAKMQQESHNDELFANTEKLKMKSLDGKMRKTDSANMQSIFRIIQSIPSPKAEPFKQWLAKVGHERIQEIENPELAAERARQYYKDLGYSDEWIDTRLQAIAARGELTDEWQKRGVEKGLEYSILTAEISEATFGMKPSEYKKFKSLKRENLRDHMTRLELIFTMLGEESTKREAIKKDAQGFEENKEAAVKGGSAAGKALDAYEEETGEKVVTDKNFKHQIAEAKRQKRLENKKKKKED